jgi:hypothetical protein
MACHQDSQQTPEQLALEDRTVLLTLELNKKGAVRDVKVLKGPETLRGAAIKAAKARTYKHRDTWPDPGSMMVEVTFPQDRNGAPEIRQAMPAGVSSCIPAPTAVRISSAVMQSRLLRRVQPTLPAEMQPVEGTVVLRLRIDKDGNVYKADKVNGPDALVAHAIEAVKLWKYEPYLLNGYLIEVETTLELQFSK